MLDYRLPPLYAYAAADRYDEIVDQGLRPGPDGCVWLYPNPAWAWSAEPNIEACPARDLWMVRELTGFVDVRVRVVGVTIDAVAVYGTIHPHNLWWVGRRDLAGAPDPAPAHTRRLVDQADGAAVGLFDAEHAGAEAVGAELAVLRWAGPTRAAALEPDGRPRLGYCRIDPVVDALPRQRPTHAARRALLAIVARHAAEPLRRVYVAHLDAHGCAPGGDCEAERVLFDALAPSDQAHVRGRAGAYALWRTANVA